MTPLSIEIQKRDGFSPPRPSHGLRIQWQSFCRDTEIAILHTQLEILCNMQRSKEDDNENTTTTTTVNAADAITTTPDQRMLVDRNVTNATTCITPFQMNINNTAAAITPPVVQSTAMVNKNSKNMYPILAGREITEIFKCILWVLGTKLRLHSPAQGMTVYQVPRGLQCYTVRCPINQQYPLLPLH